MLLEPRLDPNEQFRQRRRRARRRRAVRRLTLVGLVVVTAAGLTLGARFFGRGEPESTPTTPTAPMPAAAPKTVVKIAPKPKITPPPAEIRGVHVTMALASLEGKIGEYLSLRSDGLNTLEIDVKDENGDVAFLTPKVPLARKIDAAQPYYQPHDVAKQAADAGVYLIARVVVFEDPVLAEQRPSLAIRTPDGGVWRNSAGLGWTNPYDERVWKYNVDVAEAAVRAGFDEVMFDYVRFPTDGDTAAAIFNNRVLEPRNTTVARFLSYASSRLRPLGARVSAAVFGLSATRNLGIGQKPRRIAREVDAIYPMVYPSHYRSGEYNITDPNNEPQRTVALSLADFRRALRGRTARIVPWLQDFSLGRTYTLADVRAQIEAARTAGVGGFMLWNAEGVYTPEALQAQ
jgi:hypothetical protein